MSTFQGKGAMTTYWLTGRRDEVEDSWSHRSTFSHLFHVLINVVARRQETRSTRRLLCGYFLAFYKTIRGAMN